MGSFFKSPEGVKYFIFHSRQIFIIFGQRIISGLRIFPDIRPMPTTFWVKFGPKRAKFGIASVCFTIFLLYVTNEVSEKLALEKTRKACITIETINCTTEKQTTAIDGLSVRCSDEHSNSRTKATLLGRAKVLGLTYTL